MDGWDIISAEEKEDLQRMAEKHASDIMTKKS
jgi:hypothetical protein